MSMVKWCKGTQAYKAILDHYQDRTSKRSGVRLMNHIDEGLVILDEIRASRAAGLGYCLHPLVQDPAQDAITKQQDLMKYCDKEAIKLAYDYRTSANKYLCRPRTDNWTVKYMKGVLSPMSSNVRDMLIADKLQNRKDFLLYHYDNHARSEELNRYFNNWVEYLSDSIGVDLNLVANNVFGIITTKGTE
jgi:hypothetical protein